MKNLFMTTGLALVGTLIASATSAAPISGTFMGANVSNTTAQGGGTWTSGANAAGHWFDQSGEPGSFDDAKKIAPLADSGGHVPGNADDASIVTTITGLNPGQNYYVNLIWSGVWGWSQSSQPMWVGFDPGSVTQLPGKTGSEAPFGSWVDEPSNTGALKVWEDPIGVATADASGNLAVYVNNVAPAGNYSSFYAYNGVSYTALPVPEPGSLALLGLGGLAAVVRRRR